MHDHRRHAGLLDQEGWNDLGLLDIWSVIWGSGKTGLILSGKFW